MRPAAPTGGIARAYVRAFHLKVPEVNITYLG